MATVPNLIGPTPPAFQSFAPETEFNGGRVGPFKGSNGHWYIVCEDFNQSVGSNPRGGGLAAFKSTDFVPLTNQGTWTEVAQGPGYTTGSILSTCYYPGSGDIVNCLYQLHATSVGNFQLLTTTFDASAETFGAVSDPGEAIASTAVGSYINILIAKAGNGDIVIAWDEALTAGPTLKNYFKVLHSGTWGSKLSIQGMTATFATANQIVVDGVGNVGVLWASWPDANGGSSFELKTALYYSRIVSGALASTTTAMASASLVNNQQVSQPGITAAVYDSATDSVAFPINQERNPHAPGNSMEMDVLVGTPAAAPVFSVVQVMAPNNTDTFSEPLLAQIKTNQGLGLVFSGDPLGFHDGVLYNVSFAQAPAFVMLWATNLSTDSGSELDKVYISTASALAGPWSAKSLIYDVKANPPAQPPRFNAFAFNYLVPLPLSSGPIPPPPPPPQPGNPCGSTSGVLFELRRVYATMRPHVRIPVRGS